MFYMLSAVGVLLVPRRALSDVLILGTYFIDFTGVTMVQMCSFNTKGRAPSLHSLDNSVECKIVFVFGL